MSDADASQEQLRQRMVFVYRFLQSKTAIHTYTPKITDLSVMCAIDITAAQPMASSALLTLVLRLEVVLSLSTTHQIQPQWCADIVLRDIPKT